MLPECFEKSELAPALVRQAEKSQSVLAEQIQRVHPQAQKLFF